eukprot:15366581-Ditylum_brightwellii.AAC.1
MFCQCLAGYIHWNTNCYYIMFLHRRHAQAARCVSAYLLHWAGLNAAISREIEEIDNLPVHLICQNGVGGLLNIRRQTWERAVKDLGFAHGSKNKNGLRAAT